MRMRPFQQPVAVRGVRLLGYRRAVEQLVGRARVIDFVEIHAVVVAGRPRDGVLLVGQRFVVRALARAGYGGDGIQRPVVHVPEADLVQLEPDAHYGQAHIARRLRRIGCVAA